MPPPFDRARLEAALHAADAAGDTEAATQLAQAIRDMDTSAPASTKGSGPESLFKATVGIGDAAVTMARNLVNGPAGVLAGVMHQFGQGKFDQATYQEGKQKQLAEHPLHEPATEAGQQAAGTLDAAMQKTGIPWILNQAGDAIETAAGPEARDIAGATAQLLSLKGPKFTGKLGPGATAARRLVAEGYKLAPDVPIDGGFAGTALERHAAGVASTSRIESALSMDNQPVTQRLAASAAQLPEMTPQAVEQAWAVAGKAYEDIKKVTGPVLLPLPKYKGLFDRITKLGEDTNKFSGPTDARILALRDQLKMTTGAEIKDFIDKANQYRDDAFTTMKNATNSSDRQLARAYGEAANILEDAVDAHLSEMAAGAPTVAAKNQLGALYGAYKAAKAQFSTLHVIKNAMNPVTGAVEAKGVAAAAETGTKLHPQLQKISDAYNLTGGMGMQAPLKAARAASTSLTAADAISLGYAAGPAAAAGAIAYSAGAGPWWSTLAASLAPMAVRLAGRRYALRGASARSVQRNLGRVARGATATTAGTMSLEDAEKDAQQAVLGGNRAR